MAQVYGFVLTILIAPLIPFAVQESAPRDGTQVRTVALTRTVRIPAAKVASAGDAGQPNAPGVVGIWPGATDELPEGPTGFDVLQDGTLVITDPLLLRLLVFDAQGHSKREIPLGFAADSVTASEDGVLLVRQANTGEIHAVKREGTTSAEPTAAAPMLPEAHVVPGENRGSVLFPAASGQPQRAIQVRFAQPGSTLLSVQPLATDPDRGSFVALETTLPGGDAGTINVRKTIRGYSPGGLLVTETSAIPLDYFVPPVDELRVRNGVVYQLMTTRTEVRINEWDMNPR